MKFPEKIMFAFVIFASVLGLGVTPTSGQAPDFAISPEQSTIKF
jgi:hypothetical protein